MKKHNVVVIGAGTAGIMTASQLKRANSSLDIAIIDPADTHYYQPAWTLVGANTYDFDKTAKPISSLIPSGVIWIKDFCTSFDPENNKVGTKSSGDISYDYLVVCPGIKIDPTLVKGLAEALDKGVVCSNYTDPKHTWNVLKNFKGGVALFTQPTTPIKCGGAPQKIMYLAEDYFKKSGVRSKTDIIFATPGSVIFGVKPIAETLMKVIDRKDINIRFHHKLVEVEVEGDKRIAWYELAKDVDAGGCVVMSGEDNSLKIDGKFHYNYKKVGTLKENGRFGIPFDMMHLAPPQTAPDFIRNSPLANAGGWLDVDHHSMQSNRFNNIFGLGDSAQLPTAKTGAAIRKQVPIVVANLQQLMKDDTITNLSYNGYSSCPLVTGFGKMVLAEFDYDKNFTPDPKLKQLLVFDSSKEHWRLWMLKKYMLPYLYWNKMMKGINV